jgi:hypothetical protein
MKSRIYIAAVVLLTLFSLAVLGVKAAQAQDEEPSSGVGRVSVIHGDVATMRGDSGDWVAAGVNAPIVRGDTISTGDASRAEIQLDHATILRLGEKTEARVADLSRGNIQVQVARGIASVSVLKDAEAEVEVNTPNVAFRPIDNGNYRVEVVSENETHVMVRDGRAEVFTPQGSRRVSKGDLITIRGTDDPLYQVSRAPRQDSWDEWNRVRDGEILNAKSYRYAGRGYTGLHDLDRHGRWVYVPGYDWCWTPYVNAGWVPYRMGRWVWDPFWGWTWVSYEPWGWAPYHYGRWFFHAGYWHWWPGYRRHGFGFFTGYGFYPHYAPAYVSFIGFGFSTRRFHFGFGHGFGSIGWIPLGPYDPFYPWWGRHRHSFNVVNITNITNITNVTNVTNGQGDLRGSNLRGVLHNARVREALTTVSAEDFVNGRVVRGARSVDVATLRQGQVVQGHVPAVPTRESLRPSERTTQVAARAQGRGAEQFVTRRQPPAGPRAFNEQVREVQQMVTRHNPQEAAGNSARTNARAAGRVEIAQRNSDGEAAAPAAERQTRQSSERRAGERFGAGRAQPAPSRPAGTGDAATPQREDQNQPAARQAPRQTEPRVPAANQNERPNWRRFGAGSAQPRPGAAPSSRTQSGNEQKGRPSWDRFPTARSAPQQSSPRETGSAGAQRERSTARPAPSVSGREGSDETAPRQEGRPDWNRFPSRAAPKSEDGKASGSRSERPPLEIRKPIVRERQAPDKKFSGGASERSSPRGQGSWNSMPSAPRSLGTSQERLSAPSPRTYGGGTVRSAPSGWGISAPRGDGGGRAVSRPSGGGYSAPRGGGRSMSSPSGGGRSAPSSVGSASRGDGSSAGRASGSSSRGRGRQ